MRKLYHIAFSSHNEVLFRSEEDINYGFNCFALACLETESRPLADSEMTTHTHFGIHSDDPVRTFSRFRYSYTRHFNSKYGRRGPLGEEEPFLLEVNGLLHSQTMLSYVFRQGLHHGLSPTPFGYPHNSINAIFKQVLGKESDSTYISRKHMGKFLPRPARDLPSKYRMTVNGLLLREDVIDTSYVEELYLSPRNFLYQMNRMSSEEWKNEQMEDKNELPPITLETIEPTSYRPTISKLLLNENGRNFRNDITDLELCNLIDKHYVRLMRKNSIYELNHSERNNLGNRLCSDFRNGVISKLLGRNADFANLDQIRRCAAIPK